MYLSGLGMSLTGLGMSLTGLGMGQTGLVHPDPSFHSTLYIRKDESGSDCDRYTLSFLYSGTFDVFVSRGSDEPKLVRQT